jgi:hypothetical protein
MDEWTPWTQFNWYALGSLLTQLAFLAAALWFGQNILRTMRVFQEQFGALLKLSITGPPAERDSTSTTAKSVLGEASPYWLAPSQTEIPIVPMLTETGPSRFIGTWHRLSLWLQTPMSAPMGAPWSRVVHWLQAPLRN